MSDNNLRVSISRRTFLKGVGLLSASAALAACSRTTGTSAQSASSQSGSSQASSPLLAIIHTNDTHGHDVAVAAKDNTQGNFSLAAVAALKAEWEQKGYEVLLVDAGDATQGMPLVDTAKGAPAIAFMNACGGIRAERSARLDGFPPGWRVRSRRAHAGDQLGRLLR